MRGIWIWIKISGGRGSPYIQLWEQRLTVAVRASSQQPGAAQVGSVKCFALIFPALGPGPGRGGCGVAPGAEYWLLPATWRLSQQVVLGAGLDRYLLIYTYLK